MERGGPTEAGAVPDGERVGELDGGLHLRGQGRRW